MKPTTTLYTVLAWLALACFTLAPTARAVIPAPDGGYPSNNTAEGDDALFSLDTSQGTDNTGIGFNALFSLTTASFNTAIGSTALSNNTIGFENTAVGAEALFSNTTGGGNTADGFQALLNNTIGGNNTAIGFIALADNTTGGGNTADGFQALANNRTGNDNTATGANALLSNTTGSRNIALGVNAGFNLTTGSNNIDVGNNGVGGESRTIRIGTAATQRRTFIAGISGATVPGGVGVIVGSNGQLGTVVSSERFKHGIKPMDRASEAILALKPVTFHYKKELDPENIPQFGLVAEEVEKVNPDLVARDEQGKPYSVRYEAVNAMLLNEFLKAHRRIEEQDKRIEELTVQLKQQGAQIQKVSTQLELSKSAPQTVANSQ